MHVVGLWPGTGRRASDAGREARSRFFVWRVDPLNVDTGHPLHGIRALQLQWPQIPVFLSDQKIYKRPSLCPPECSPPHRSLSFSTHHQQHNRDTLLSIPIFSNLTLVKMKFSYTVLPLLALGVSAAPSTTIEARNASPINAGAISLIESLEGFRADFYYINGHKTIGMIFLQPRLQGERGTNNNRRLWPRLC